MNSIRVFEEYTLEYDKWFDENRFVYESELNILKKIIPKGKGLEIGVGTARFAAPLGIKIGVEPAGNMAEIANGRGIEVVEGRAENIPFKNSVFDFILIVVTICFVDNPKQILREARRILKPDGKLIIGLIDRDSFLGRIYEEKKEKSKFYRYANFYSTKQVLEWLKKLGFKDYEIYQTIFRELDDIKEVEPIKKGYGKGGFIVISSIK